MGSTTTNELLLVNVLLLLTAISELLDPVILLLDSSDTASELYSVLLLDVLLSEQEHKNNIPAIMMVFTLVMVILPF
jgi:hypothetical protein